MTSVSLPYFILFLAFAFQVKHFVIDFPLQFEFQYLNKGTYGHPGGLLHSGLHGAGTLAILIFFVPPTLSLCLAITDAVIHYHIDWAKVNLNRKMGWGPTTHNEFWTLLGVDQLLHQLTYIVIIFFAITPL